MAVLPLIDGSGNFQTTMTPTQAVLPATDCSGGVQMVPPQVSPSFIKHVSMSAGAAVTADLVSVFAAFRAYAAALSGLTSYHRMNELAGNLADSGPNAIVGTAVGAPTYGNPGLMLPFDLDTSIGFAGVVDYFNLGNPAALRFTNEMTVFIVWEYGGPAGVFGPDYALAGHGDPFADWAWAMQLQSGTTGLSFYAFDSAAVAIFAATYGAALDLPGVHTAALTYSVLGGTAVAYIDGVAVDTKAVVNPLRVPAVNPDNILGGLNYGGIPQVLFNGRIQPLVTYNVARTAAEILQMHRLATVTAYTGKVIVPGIALGASPYDFVPQFPELWFGSPNGDIRIIGSNATPISAVLETFS